MVIEKVRDDLNEKQMSVLMKKLNSILSPFKVSERGSVDMKEIEEGHPKIRGHACPVGFLGNNTEKANTYYAELVNKEYDFFKPAHRILKKMYLDV